MGATMSTVRDWSGGSHHLYVHVPFCRLVCAYCDFVTVGGRATDVPRYVDALVAELASRPAPGELRTVYVGGGTPSLLPASAVGRVLRAAEDRWTSRPVEVTLEANPSARERPDWGGLRSVGVTRISLGVQSLRDDDLRALARGHSADEARTAFRAARAAGFENISIDLIYGIPAQGMAEWRAGLLAALELGPDHVSLYALQLAMAPDEWASPPRPGALRWRRRMAAEQDDGLAADQYGLAEEILANAGYHHYELSSWARAQRESLHNSAYWARLPYTGIGAGAHSYDGARDRRWNERDLDAYLSAVEAGRPPVAGGETLDDDDAAFEAIALGLRRVSGLSREAFAAEFGSEPGIPFAGGLAAGIAGGLLEEAAPDRIRLTARGRLLASEVLVGFLPSPANDAVPA
jgi:oxygen-independent coproporphyrinogen-3 oxidase